MVNKDDDVVAPPKKDDVVMPPKRDDVVAPPKKDDVVIPPKRDDVIAPPKEDDVVIPPKRDDVIAPPKKDDIVMPPKRDDVVAPPKKDDVVMPPKRDDVVAPPKKDDVVIPPKRDDVVAPPQKDDVVMPPKRDDVVAPLQRPGDVVAPPQSGQAQQKEDKIKTPKMGIKFYLSGYLIWSLLIFVVFGTFSDFEKVIITLYILASNFTYCWFADYQRYKGGSGSQLFARYFSVSASVSIASGMNHTTGSVKRTWTGGYKVSSRKSISDTVITFLINVSCDGTSKIINKHPYCILHIIYTPKNVKKIYCFNRGKRRLLTN